MIDYELLADLHLLSKGINIENNNLVIEAKTDQENISAWQALIEQNIFPAYGTPLDVKIDSAKYVVLQLERVTTKGLALLDRKLFGNSSLAVSLTNLCFIIAQIYDQTQNYTASGLWLNCGASFLRGNGLRDTESEAMYLYLYGEQLYKINERGNLDDAKLLLEANGNNADFITIRSAACDVVELFDSSYKIHTVTLQQNLEHNSVLQAIQLAYAAALIEYAIVNFTDNSDSYYRQKAYHTCGKAHALLIELAPHFGAQIAVLNDVEIKLIAGRELKAKDLASCLIIASGLVCMYGEFDKAEKIINAALALPLDKSPETQAKLWLQHGNIQIAIAMAKQPDAKELEKLASFKYAELAVQALQKPLPKDETGKGFEKSFHDVSLVM